MAREVLYKIKPKFNLFYEMSLPDKKRMRRTFITLVAFILFIILLNLFLATGSRAEAFSSEESQSNITNVNIFLVIVTSIPLIMISSQAIFRAVQYKCTSYEFFERYLEYKDSFLNQEEKTIEYIDIKEIGLAKKILDRIMGFGTITIRTNAENENENGIIMVSIKNPQQAYEAIDEIIHKKVAPNHNEKKEDEELTIKQGVQEEKKIEENNGVQVNNPRDYSQTREEELMEYQQKEKKEMEDIEKMQDPSLIKLNDPEIDGGIKTNY